MVKERRLRQVGELYDLCARNLDKGLETPLGCAPEFSQAIPGFIQPASSLPEQTPMATRAQPILPKKDILGGEAYIWGFGGLGSESFTLCGSRNASCGWSSHSRQADAGGGAVSEWLRSGSHQEVDSSTLQRWSVWLQFHLLVCYFVFFVFVPSLPILYCAGRDT
jgi:hypothetical protein